MNPSQERPTPGSTNFRQTCITSPFDALKAPSVIRPIATHLLASKTHAEGGIEELYHEVPSLDGHKGAIFYVSETPTLLSREDSPTYQRVFYTMVPDSGSQRFISEITEEFNRSFLPFEERFTNGFNGQFLTEYPTMAE